jgi:predicted amidohydrolase YtcJ
MAMDGYVTVHDAGLDASLMAALTELEEEGRLPIRVYAMLSARDADLSRLWIEKGPDSDADSMLVTRSVKAYYDGALGSRGAKMLSDYSDKAGHRGVSGGEYGFDQELVTQLMARGFQVGVHAIGDAGNRETLDFFQQVFELHPQSQKNRHRIEHAQVIHPDDLPRLSRMKIIASMEPPHAVEDKTWAQERIGSERIKGAYAWQTLRRSGAIVIFNADNPGSDHSIFYGLHSAITRQDKSLQPEGGWYPEQAFTIEQSIRAYTTLAAYAAFRELETGSIEIGKWADLTVMDIDPFGLAKSEPHKILGGRIEMTIVAGKVVYDVHD